MNKEEKLELLSSYIKRVDSIRKEASSSYYVRDSEKEAKSLIETSDFETQEKVEYAIKNQSRYNSLSDDEEKAKEDNSIINGLKDIRKNVEKEEKIKLVADFFKRENRINNEADYTKNNVSDPEKQAKSMVENDNKGMQLVVNNIISAQKEYNSLSDDEKKANDKERVDEIVRIKPLMNAVEKSMDKAIEKSFGKDGNKKDYKDNLKKEIAKDVKVFAVTEKFKSATKTFACGVKSQADKLKTTILNRMRGNQK